VIAPSRHRRDFRRLGLVATAVLGLLLSACLSRRATTPPGPQEADVYAAVLAHVFATSPRDDSRPWVLRDSTAQFLRERLVAYFWDDLHVMSGGDSSVVADFEVRSRLRHPLAGLAPTIARRSGIALIVSTDSAHRRVRAVEDSLRQHDPATRTLQADVYWRAFRMVYPATAAGVVTLSSVGFSRDGQRAIVNVDYSCGALCGGGRVVSLWREGRRWRVLGSRQTWVS
jgi:hypothetical protein